MKGPHQGSGFAVLTRIISTGADLNAAANNALWAKRMDN